MTLPVRTIADTAADHVIDHNALHAFYNANAGVGSSDITIHGTDEVNGSGVVSWPASMADDDFAIWICLMRNSTSTGPDAGAGWSNLYRDDVSSNEWVEIWYRGCNGTETGTIANNNVSVLQSAALIVLRGVDPITPFNHSAVDHDTNDLWTPSAAGNPLGYALWVWMNVYNGIGTPALVSQVWTYPLTELINVESAGHDEQIFVLGRDTKQVSIYPEKASGIHTSGYLSTALLVFNPA